MMFNGLKKTVEKNPSDHSWCHHFQSIQKVSIDFFFQSDLVLQKMVLTTI